MYRFLQNPRRFSWPDDGRKEGDWHYKFADALDPRFGELLGWQRRLDSKERSKVAMVDQYRITDKGQEEIPFDQPFAVKGVNSIDLFENEVKLMSDLRYVHVAALLATYETPDRYFLLIFPAGCCDLREIMTCISYGIANIPWVYPSVAEKTLQCHETYRWPFKKPLVEKLVMLQNFFFCLCQALKYLHDSNLRHKDIKPENIIIDFSGNVVMMDFGISKKVEAVEGITDSYGARTGIYAPPEVLNGLKRGYQSDVFSLGCVFIQMATLLLGYTLDEFWEFCSIQQGTEKDHTLARMPDKIENWIKILRESTQSPLLFQEDVEHIKASLSTISRMLDQKRLRRPKTNELLEVFDFQRPKCRDCNSDDVNERWEPSQQQKEARESGKRERLILHINNKDDLDHDITDYVVPDEMAGSVAKLSSSALEAPHRTRNSMDSLRVDSSGPSNSRRSEPPAAPQRSPLGIIRNPGSARGPSGMRPSSPAVVSRSPQSPGSAGSSSPRASRPGSPTLRFMLTPPPDTTINNTSTRSEHATANSASKRFDILGSQGHNKPGNPRARNGSERSEPPLARPGPAEHTSVGANSTPNTTADVDSPEPAKRSADSAVADDVFESDSSNDKAINDTELEQLRKKFQRRGSEHVVVYDCSRKRLTKWEFAAFQGKVRLFPHLHPS
jgi:serine/threonine protein kinase